MSQSSPECLFVLLRQPFKSLLNILIIKLALKQPLLQNSLVAGMTWDNEVGLVYFDICEPIRVL
jgi:hypothetical protein